MAHYVAKKLHLRPSDILDHWGVCELIVSYGIYANEESMKHFYEIKEYNKNADHKEKLPRQYAVMFYSPDDTKELERQYEKGDND